MSRTKLKLSDLTLHLLSETQPKMIVLLVSNLQKNLQFVFVSQEKYKVELSHIQILHGGY